MKAIRQGGWGEDGVRSKRERKEDGRRGKRERERETLIN